MIFFYYIKFKTYRFHNECIRQKDDVPYFCTNVVTFVVKICIALKMLGLYLLGQICLHLTF